MKSLRRLLVGRPQSLQRRLTVLTTMAVAVTQPTLTPICSAVSTLAQPWPYVSCMCAARALNGTASEHACIESPLTEPKALPDLQTAVLLCT